MPAVIAFIPELIAAAATAAEVGAPLELASATMTGMGVFGSLGAAVAGGSLLSSVSGLALSFIGEPGPTLMYGVRPGAVTRR